MKVCIIGMGLIGGSLGLALKHYRPSTTVYGVVRKKNTIDRVLKMGAADKVFINPIDAIEGADWIVLATNPESFALILKNIASHLTPNQIVTDVGSVKTSVMKTYKHFLKNNIPYIGSHPIAGSEKKGIEAARWDLFKKATCIITPDPETSSKTLAKAVCFWKIVRAIPVSKTPDEHDQIFAYVSHLPHFISFCLAHMILQQKDFSTMGGEAWRDMTRIARSPSSLWLEIFLLNRSHLLDALQNFLKEIHSLMKKLKKYDRELISQFLKDSTSLLASKKENAN